MPAVPLVDTKIGHDPMIGLSFVRGFKLTYIRIADMAIVPTCFGRIDDSRTRLPNISIVGGNTFVKVHVIYNFKGISIFAYKSVTDSIFILYDAGRVVIMSRSSAEFIFNPWSYGDWWFAITINFTLTSPKQN